MPSCRDARYLPFLRPPSPGRPLTANILVTSFKRGEFIVSPALEQIHHHLIQENTDDAADEELVVGTLHPDTLHELDACARPCTR